jgi:hypothetical protein
MSYRSGRVITVPFNGNTVLAPDSTLMQEVPILLAVTT